MIAHLKQNEFRPSPLQRKTAFLLDTYSHFSAFFERKENLSFKKSNICLILLTGISATQRSSFCRRLLRFRNAIESHKFLSLWSVFFSFFRKKKRVYTTKKNTHLKLIHQAASSSFKREREKKSALFSSSRTHARTQTQHHRL